MTSSSYQIYIGTYTGKGSQGIYRYTVNGNTGEFTSAGLAAPVKNPSFLALSPDRQHLYCCNEISDFNGQTSGAATSFRINPDTLTLEQLDQSPSGGLGPCYVSVTPDGAGVFVANYGSGDAAIIATEPNGALAPQPSAVAHHTGKSVVPKRQDAPHVHCVRSDASGRWGMAVDLGIDKIIAYPVNGGTMSTTGAVENATRPGSGPRHIAFHPNSRWAYNSNELDSTLAAWNWDAETGRLSEIASTTTLPADYKGDENYPAEVLVHPSGKFVYLSNRGQNAVAVFAIDQASGAATPIQWEPTLGDHPRGMTLSPDGKLLIVANQNTDSLVSYKIDEATGKLTQLSKTEGISKPTHILFYAKAHGQ